MNHRITKYKSSSGLKIITFSHMRFPLFITLFASFILLICGMFILDVPYLYSKGFIGNYYNNAYSMFDDGIISSLDMLQIPPSTTLYPVVWYDFVTGIIGITRVNAIVVTNVFIYFMLTIVWPVSMLAFGWCISSNRIFLSIVGVFSGILAFVFVVNIPYVILYANIVVVCFLPLVFLVCVSFFLTDRLFNFNQVFVLSIFSFLAFVVSQLNVFSA